MNWAQKVTEKNWLMQEARGIYLGKQTGLAVTFPKWICSLKRHHVFIFRYLCPFNCEPSTLCCYCFATAVLFIHPSTVTHKHIQCFFSVEVMIVPVLINHSWKLNHRKKLVRTHKKTTTKNVMAKHDVVYAHFVSHQDYQWIPYCRCCLTLLLLIPFFIHANNNMRHGLNSFVFKLAQCCYRNNSSVFSTQ